MLRRDRDNGVVNVLIDFPPLNLVGGDFLLNLIRVLSDFEQDPTIKVVVFRSADPDFFLMHGDAQMMANAPIRDYAPATEPNLAASTFLRVSRAPFVTIGVVDGAARGGGCEFLSALDLRIGTPRVVIGQPEAALGILPGAGGTARWARIAGRARALELMLTARDIDATEALAMGWLQRVVPADQIDLQTDLLARRIARLSRASIAAIKQVIDISLTGIDDALVAETDALERIMASGAHLEPMRRFLAAGGQIRESELEDMGSLIDAALGIAVPTDEVPAERGES